MLHHLVLGNTTTTWIAIGSGATFVLASATGAVAAITWRLANKTNELAEATKATAQATRDAVDAIEEPFVIAVPTPREVIAAHAQDLPAGAIADLLTDRNALREINPEIHRWTAGTVSVLRLRLWNVGSGPGIVTSVALRRDGDPWDWLGDLVGGFRPMGAGEIADMEIPVTGWPPVLGDGTLVIDYTHANGTSYRTHSQTSIGDPAVKCLTYDRSRM